MRKRKLKISDSNSDSLVERETKSKESQTNPAQTTTGNKIEVFLKMNLFLGECLNQRGAGKPWVGVGVGCHQNTLQKGISGERRSMSYSETSKQSRNSTYV